MVAVELMFDLLAKNAEHQETASLLSDRDWLDVCAMTGGATGASGLAFGTFTVTAGLRFLLCILLLLFF